MWSYENAEAFADEYEELMELLAALAAEDPE